MSRTGCSHRWKRINERLVECRLCGYMRKAATKGEGRGGPKADQGEDPLMRYTKEQRRLIRKVVRSERTGYYTRTA